MTTDLTADMTWLLSEGHAGKDAAQSPPERPTSRALWYSEEPKIFSADALLWTRAMCLVVKCFLSVTLLIFIIFCCILTRIRLLPRLIVPGDVPENFVEGGSRATEHLHCRALHIRAESPLSAAGSVDVVSGQRLVETSQEGGRTGVGVLHACNNLLSGG